MAKRDQIQPLVSVLTLSINIQKNGVEIRFPGDPGEEVRAILTENGWRFNPYGNTSVRWQDPTWYKRHTPESMKFAKDLVGLLGGVDHTGPALTALAAAQAIPAPLPPPATLAVMPAVAPTVPAQPKQETAPAAPTESADPLQGTVEIKVPALAA